MKFLTKVGGLIILLILSSCAGGGGAGGGNTGGTSNKIIGYAFTTGPFQKTAVYSDGSVEGVGTEIASGGGNLLSISISGKTFMFETGNVVDGITVWQVSSTGNVSQLGSYLDSSGCAPGSLATSKTGTELFVGCGNGGIDTFTINADGSLTTLQAPAYTAGTNHYINSMALDQSGTYLIVNAAVTTTDSEFLQLTVGGGGTLTLSSSQTGIVGWQSTLISDPNTTHGNYFYAGGSGDTNYYIVSESGGTITATEQTALEVDSWPVWIDQTGSWLTSLNSKTNTPQTTYIQQYSVGTSGTLTTNGSSITINSMWEDSSSPAQYDSSYGYVIMRAENAIIVGAPNTLNGSMTIKGTGTGGYGGLAYVPVG
jgi:hypothetical protein